MPSTYKTPGVYVEEISKFPPSVAQVETAIPAFLGYVQKDNGGTPLRITSLLEYEEAFGTTTAATYVVAVDAEGEITVTPTIPNYLLYYSMVSFFANGGGPCYIIPVGVQATPAVFTVDNFTDGLLELEKWDEPTIILAPDAVNLDQAAYITVMNTALQQCTKLQDRFTVMDVKGADSDGTIKAAWEAFRNGVSGSIDEAKYGAAYLPYLKTIQNPLFEDSGVAVTVTIPPEDVATGEDAEMTGTLADIKEVENDAYNKIKAKISSVSRVVIPPSGAVAGIYAKTDSNRGVWKAPAGMDSGLNGVIGPTVKVNNDMQDGLNIDTTAGKSINAIRTFTGKGTLIWGARTLAGNDNEWRYVPVRRFFNMVEESTKKATERFVFEPNDANTWVKVRSMIENFLIVQWRAGALAGAKPEDAFFVKVGINQTMTAQDILEGYMIVEIGMAVVRPAEFIILRFSHKMQES